MTGVRTLFPRYLLAAGLIAAALGPAGGQERDGEPPKAGQPDQAPAAADPIQAAPSTGEPTIAPLLGPLGDPGGARSFLADRGIAYSLTYIGDTLSNVTGGLKRGTSYVGLLDTQIDVDLDRLAGWRDAALHANIYQIHGRGLSRYYVGNILTVSDLEALPATRLYELWFEQRLFADRVSVRVGQLAADQEFLVSDYAALFLNASLGWPPITGANLPSGGPAYPQATPGVRVDVRPNDQVTLLAALFNGDPAGPGTAKDPQLRDHSGLEFRTRDPAFVIGEIQVAHDHGERDTGLPGTLKLGAWHHFGRFDDERFGADGLLLADPNEQGPARRLRGNQGVYAVVDQLLTREQDAPERGLGFFLRAGLAPSDRNLIGAYLDGGLTYRGLFPGRPNDSVGIAAMHARVSDSVRAYDRDVDTFTGQPRPVRSSETAIEATYQAILVPGWSVQPNVQYVIRPGAGGGNPRTLEPGPRLKDAAIVGVRTVIRY